MAHRYPWRADIPEVWSLRAREMLEHLGGLERKVFKGRALLGGGSFYYFLRAVVAKNRPRWVLHVGERRRVMKN